MISGKSELQLFSSPAPQAVVDSAIFMDVNPTTSLSESSGTIDFVINGSGTDYLDLNDSLLYVRLKVLGADLRAMADTYNATPSNFFLNALFSDVTLTLNDTVVEGGNHLYPYKATMDAIFNFNADAKRLQLEPAGFCNDEAIRKAWISQSKVLDLVGTLRLDFLNQPKYLLPGVR